MWKAVSCEVGLKLVYDSAQCSVWQCMYLPESRVVIHCDEIIEVMATEEVRPNFCLRSTWPFMRMKTSLNLVAVE